jgi:carboxypeptidase C (cathepsin A)
VLDEAERFAERDYPWALARGARMTADERADAATTLARLTGLSVDYIDRVDLRIEHVRFFTELLRARRRTVGRLDGRFLGWDADYGFERYSDDPSMDAIMGPYTAAFNHYVRTELTYENDLAYNILTDKVHPWSLKEFEGQHLYVADRLSAAMRANPHLRLYVASGYQDGATPYFATEHTLAHLAIPAELRGNIEVEYFEAGHMMYVHEPSRLAQSEHLRAFVRRPRG